MVRSIGNVQKDAQVRAVASGALSNGDTVVVNADGTVSVVAASGGGPSVGSSAVFETANIYTTGATFDSNSNKVVITYQDLGNSGYGTAVVGTVSGTSISFGTPTVFASASVSYFNSATTFDSNSNKVVVAYRNPSDNNRGYAIVGTVSGTSISFGTAVRFETGITAYIGATFDSNSNKVVIVFRDDSNSNYGKAIVGTVSGTSISYGAAATYYDGTSSYNTATFDSNSNKVVIAYQRGSAGNCIVGTVSGTSISFGTTVQFDNSTGEMKPVFDSDSNKVVVAYNKSNAGKAVVGTVSGTSISFGTAVQFNATAAGLAPVFDSDSNKVVVAYYNGGNSNYGEVIVGTVSGTDISFGSAVALNNASTTQIAATFDTNSNKMTIAYSDGGNSSYGTASVLSTDGTNLTSENYIGMSSGVTEITSSETGTAVTYDSSETAYQAATFDSTNNKVVIGYRDSGNSNYGTAVVATVTGTTISYGSPSVFESGTTNHIVATFDSNAGKVVFVYQDGSNSSFATAVVGTVSGTSISFGTPVVFESSNSEDFGITFDSTNNKVVIAMRDNSGPGGDEQRGRAIVGTVSGTSISFGSATSFLADNTDAVSIAYDTTAQKVVISFQDSGSSNRGTAIVGTVSGTSISFGTAAQFELNEIASASATTYDPVNNKVLISYRDSTSGVGKAVVGTLSGTNISFGTAATFLSSNAVNITSAYDTETGAVVITYKNNSDNYTYAVAATISGTSVTFSDILTVENSNTTTDTASTYDTNANKSIATYKYNPASTGEGRAVVFKVGVENRFPIADGAAASIDIIGSVSTNQSGLTAGQQYFVQTGGTIGTTADSPSVLAGTAISATELLVKT